MLLGDNLGDELAAVTLEEFCRARVAARFVGRPDDPGDGAVLAEDPVVGRRPYAGLEALRAAVAPFPPERVAPACEIPAETIRRLARELARADRAVVYGRIGTHTVEFGTIAAWAVVRFVMRFEWYFEPAVIIVTVTLSTLLTLGFGFLGTWRALGHKAAPLLRNE